MEPCYSYAYMVDSFSSWCIELAAVYVYVPVCTPVSLFATLDSLQAIHSLLLQVVSRLDAIEPRITAIEQNALLSVPPSPVPSYTSSIHDDMAFCSPLTRQGTPFSPLPTPMLPPAQPGPSYQQPSASSKQFATPVNTPELEFTSQAAASSKLFSFSATGSSQQISLSKPPVSPTKQTLKPVDVVIRHNSKLLNPTGIGRLAIALARESVFGPDIMASNRLTEEGLLFIEQTLRHLLPGVSDADFNENYWKPSRQAIKRACDRAKAKKREN